MRFLVNKLFVILLIYITSLFCIDPNTFQLVESVPMETSLGLPETFTTQSIWLDMINSAQKTIDMEIFYLSHKPGSSLEQVIYALKKASNRGVLIRIIADSKMAKNYPETLDELGKLPNISVRFISIYNQLGGVMHAKYFIVDNKELFLGSQNMDWRALEHIHELGIRIHNEKLSRLIKHIFELDWSKSGADSSSASNKLPKLSDAMIISANRPVNLMDSKRHLAYLYPTFSFPGVTPQGLEWDENAILRLIDNAKDHIEIQLLSYKPHSASSFYEKIDLALRKAAGRKVQIKMIVSNWNTQNEDIPFLKSLQLIPNITISISNIPQWSGGFIPYARVEHCKYMVVDSDLTWIGTSNWSYSYFYTSRNIGLVIKNKNVNQTVHKVFLKSWLSEYCHILDVCKEYKPPKISSDEEK